MWRRFATMRGRALVVRWPKGSSSRLRRTFCGRFKTSQGSRSTSIAASGPRGLKPDVRCRGDSRRSLDRCAQRSRSTIGVTFSVGDLRMEPLRRNEYERMWRVLDMTITGHSILRDRYARRERAITLTIMALSIVTVSLAFVNGESHVTLFGVEAKLATWVGSLSAGIFFLALLDLLVDWKRSSWAHGDAALRLSALKSKFRAASIDGDNVDSGGIDLRAEYQATMDNVVVMPESRFLELKRKHRRKVAVSRLIDEHPGAPLVFVRMKAVWQGLHSESKAGDDQLPIEEVPH